jgi:hypothetical protein
MQLHYRFGLRLCCAGFALLLPAVARAAVIAQYTVPNVETGQTGPGFAATTTDPAVRASPISGAGPQIFVGAENPTPEYSTQPVLRVNPLGNATSAATAVTNNVYFSFTVSPAIEAFMDLSSLTFNTARGGGSTPRGFAVRSSLDNFNTNLFTLDVPTQRPTFTPVNVDLSAFPETNRPVTFRIYTYAPLTGNTIEFDDITLNGTVTLVPEPTGLCLLGLGGLMLTARRRGRC